MTEVLEPSGAPGKYVPKRPANFSASTEPGDETLICLDCNQSFTYTVEEQSKADELYREKGFHRKPDSCPACRSKRTSGRSTGGRGGGAPRFGGGRGDRGGQSYGSSYGGDRDRNGGGGVGVCRAFQRGECTRGSSCRYSHEEGGSGGGRSYGRGDRDGGYGGDRGRDSGRGSGGSGVCYAFQRGECTRGSSCRYSHDEGREGGGGGGGGDFSSFGRSSSNGQSKPCFAFQRGECERGSSCRFSHEM